MKRLGHFVLLIFMGLTYLIIMINSYSLQRFRPLYIPDDNYYNIDYDESTVADEKHILNIEKRFPEDIVANNFVEPNTSIKKRNSEIISALMGLRRAMSNHYAKHRVHE